MSFWNNTLSEKAGLTGVLLSPTGLRVRLMAVPILASMVPTLDHVHAGVAAVTATRTTDDAERELAALSEEGAALDADGHDRPARGLHACLTGLADLASADEADGYRALAARILPQGLATTQQTWMGQAGNASRLQRELAEDVAFRSALEAIPLPGKRTMLDAVQGFVSAGLRLGEIELRRAALRRTIASAATADAEARESGKEAPQIGVARKQWVDAVELLRGIVSMPQSPVPADVREDVLALFDEAEKKGDARARARAAARKESAAQPTEETTKAAEKSAPALEPAARPSKPPAPTNGAVKPQPNP